MEKELLEETVDCILKACSEGDGVLVGVFPLKQREKDVCCCNCRVAARLTVLSKEDMSDAPTGYSRSINARENCKTVGVVGRGQS